VPDLTRTTLAQQAELVRSGQTTARELTDTALSRIAELNPQLGAFRVVLAERARAEAADRDAAPALGEQTPLLGVPIAIKDELDVAGELTTFGGAAQQTPAADDSEAVRRLRAAGAVIVGKTCMPEFGAFPFTESAANGYTRNPWDATRTPGGSSGGSAVAVATGMVAAAMGGDGGGSIRIPAACCGLFGLKPQRGRVSSGPNPHLWYALGTIGPLTRTVLDSAIVYDVIAGSLDTDRWHAEPPRMPFTAAATTPPGRLRIGYSSRPAFRGLRPHREHVAAVLSTAELLREQGHDVREVRPHYPDPSAAFVPQFYAGVRAEAALVDRPELLERRTKRLVRLGRMLPEAAVQQTIRLGERIGARVNRVFDDVDLLLTPTIAHRPPRVGALAGAGVVQAELRALPMIAYTAIWNVAGNPAASVPAGFGADGLPVGVQLVGRPHDEPTVLQVAAQLEATRPWADRWPPGL
jgi:amidase